MRGRGPGLIDPATAGSPAVRPRLPGLPRPADGLSRSGRRHPYDGVGDLVRADHVARRVDHRSERSADGGDDGQLASRRDGPDPTDTQRDAQLAVGTEGHGRYAPDGVVRAERSDGRERVDAPVGRDMADEAAIIREGRDVQRRVGIDGQGA